MSTNLIRLPRVTKKTGKCRTSIYEGMAAGTFPKPIKLSARSVAWLESEIDQWIEERIAASRNEEAA